MRFPVKQKRPQTSFLEWGAYILLFLADLIVVNVQCILYTCSSGVPTKKQLYQNARDHLAEYKYDIYQ